MKKLLNIFEKSPEHYPPKSLDDIDWEWEERHSIRRFYRQNSPTVFLISTALAILLIHFLVTGSFFSGLFSGFLLLTLLLMYQDVYRSGYRESGDFGEYWKIRSTKVEMEVERAQSGNP